jgi:hypothetical protein
MDNPDELDSNIQSVKFLVHAVQPVHVDLTLL